MNKMIISKRYKLIEKIGEGSFGKIYKCINKFTGRIIKAIIPVNNTPVAI